MIRWVNYDKAGSYSVLRNGEIEVLINPTFRIATVLYDKDGINQGVIVHKKSKLIL